jgi:hypothetical protein
VNRPVLSDRLAYTCDSADFRSGISATREDFIAVPSAAVTTRPETVHGGGSFSAGLAFWAAETSGSSKRAAATLNSADNIWHNPQSRDVLAILPCLSTGLQAINHVAGVHAFRCSKARYEIETLNGSVPTGVLVVERSPFHSSWVNER